jgi:serine/threonine protein kinase
MILFPYYAYRDLYHYYKSRTGFVLDERTIRNYIKQILIALKGIHSLGIVHRDLKPENIMMDSDMNLYLGDFGFALHV